MWELSWTLLSISPFCATCVCVWPSQEFSRYMYDLYGWLEAHVQANVNSTRRHQ